MKLKRIEEAITDRRGVVKRLLYTAALSVLALLILVPAALAQTDSPGPRGATQPCPFQLDLFPEGTVCGEGGAYIEPAPDGAVETITCEDFEDQGQAQEALNRVLRGDPAADAEDLDDDGDGIACEELPTATDPNAPAPGTEEDGEITCEDFEDQGQAQQALGRGLRGDPAYDPEILDEDGDGIACEELPTATDPNAPGTGGETTDGETTDGEAKTGEGTAADGETPAGGTGGEGTAGGAAETADNNGGTPGADEGGSGGGNGTAEGDGGSQGGLALAVNDGLGNISRGRLPETGGGWAVLLVAGAVLIVGGWLLVRRFSPSRS